VAFNYLSVTDHPEDFSRYYGASDPNLLNPHTTDLGPALRLPTESALGVFYRKRIQKGELTSHVVVKGLSRPSEISFPHGVRNEVVFSPDGFQQVKRRLAEAGRDQSAILQFACIEVRSEETRCCRRWTDGTGNDKMVTSSAADSI
jgi:hypothetical protein